MWLPNQTVRSTLLFGFALILGSSCRGCEGMLRVLSATNHVYDSTFHLIDSQINCIILFENDILLVVMYEKVVLTHQPFSSGVFKPTSKAF